MGHPDGAQQIPRFAPTARRGRRDDNKERAIERERIVVEGRSSCWDGGDAVSIDNRAPHLQQQPSLRSIFQNLIWTGMSEIGPGRQSWGAMSNATRPEGTNKLDEASAVPSGTIPAFAVTQD